MTTFHQRLSLWPPSTRGCHYDHLLPEVAIMTTFHQSLPLWPPSTRGCHYDHLLPEVAIMTTFHQSLPLWPPSTRGCHYDHLPPEVVIMTTFHQKLSLWQPLKWLVMTTLASWQLLVFHTWNFNTLWPWQNGHHFADDIFKCIFLKEIVWISLNISLNFVLTVQISNIPALVQIMAWRQPGDKPLSGPMMVYLTDAYVSLGFNELMIITFGATVGDQIDNMTTLISSICIDLGCQIIKEHWWQFLVT